MRTYVAARPVRNPPGHIFAGGIKMTSLKNVDLGGVFGRLDGRSKTGLSTASARTDKTTKQLLDSGERKMAVRMLFGVFITICECFSLPPCHCRFSPTTKQLYRDSP
jgi:hypothetical protein